MRVAYHNPVGLFICGLFYVSVSKTIINNKQGDLYQVLEYARKRDIQDVYLLYPMYRYEEKEKEFPVAVSESPSGDINVHFIRMPLVAMHWEHRFNSMVHRYNEIYRVQIPNITPHVCRHTYCSNMAKSGMNPKALQYLMGHSDISVTLNTYTHVNLEDAREEVARIQVV